MREIDCLGIFREDDHSPGRVSDDHAVLEAVASRMASLRGFNVSLARPDELANGVIQRLAPDVIFYMCEEAGPLDAIESADAPVKVNSVRGVKNTFRENICRIFSGRAFFPGSCMTAPDFPDIPAGMAGNVWVKRGDYHAVEPGDVQFAGTAERLEELLREFKRRGIGSVMLQKNVSGDLIKFYGVADRWFRWFYHMEHEAQGHPVDEGALRRECGYAAELAEVEVYGGDAIVSSDGSVHIIDLNAWPSFALFRDEAAGHIAAHIASRAEKEVKSG